MSQTMNLLTASEVTKALRTGEARKLKDGGSLVLIVTGKGKGKWLYQGRLPGRRTLIDLVCGHAPETSLSEARERREQYRALLKQGINPNVQRRQELEEARRKAAATTFGSVAEEYLSKLGDVTPKTLEGERGRVHNHMKPIAGLPIAEIRRLEHLKPLIDGLVHKEQREQARRVAGLIGRIFRYALSAGYVDSNPADSLGMLLPRQRVEERKHHAAATDNTGARQLFGQIWSYVDSGRSSFVVTCAMRLACYIPCRISNVLSLTWQQVDFEQGELLFTRTKNGKTYIVPMSRQVRELVTKLVEYQVPGDGYCFPGFGKTPHISDGALRAVLRKAGIGKEQHSLHGTRSTFQSLALEYGMPSVLTERALFHVAGGAVRQAYDRALYREPLKAAYQWWSDTVDALRQGQAVPELPELLKVAYK